MVNKTIGNQNSSEEAPEIDLGDLVPGFGSFVNLLGKLVQSDEIVEKGEGVFRVKGQNEQLHGVCGFSICSGIGGHAPHVQAFGNMRTSGAGFVVDGAREPLLDLVDEGNEIVISAELSGVLEAEIFVSLNGDLLTIKTTGDRLYAKQIFLEKPLITESLRQSYSNGVLEIRIQKAHSTGIKAERWGQTF